jgi:hypothetical protein
VIGIASCWEPQKAATTATATSKAFDADAVDLNGETAGYVNGNCKRFGGLLVKAHAGSLSSVYAEGVAVPNVFAVAVSAPFRL